MAIIIKRKNIFTSFLLLSSLLFLNCEKDKAEPVVELNEGLFVLCEGNFGWGNASITNYNLNSEGSETSHNYFKEVNGYNLGDVAQSIYTSADKYFIVVNNSSKLEVVSRSDFNVAMTIEDLGSPRYFIPINDSIAYVSDLWNNKIHIINYINGLPNGEIAVNGWAEQMEKIADSVYVSLYDSQSIGVINTNTNSLLHEITLDLSPLKVEKDKNGKLWVIASEYEGQSKLYKIDPETRAIELTITFEADEPLSYMDIAANSNYIYLASSIGNIYKMSINAESLPDVLFNVDFTSLYGLNVDNEGNIYLCDAHDFVQNGSLSKYNEFGEFEYSITSGVSPNSAVFR